MYKKKIWIQFSFFFFATVRVWPYFVRYSHPYTLFLQTRMANRSTIHKRGWIRSCTYIYTHLARKRCACQCMCVLWCYAFPIPEGRSIILYCSMCVFVIVAQQYGHASTVYDASHTHTHKSYLCCCYCSITVVVCMCVCVSVCCMPCCLMQYMFLFSVVIVISMRLR